MSDRVGPDMTAAATAGDRQDGEGGNAGVSAAPGSITLGRMANASLVRIVGDLGLDSVLELQKVLGAALGRHAWIIVDLSLTAIVDRVALNTLVTGSYAARGRGGGLLLVAPSDLVHIALDGARMRSAFTTFPTLPQALSEVSAKVFAAAGAVRKRGGPRRR